MYIVEILGALLVANLPYFLLYNKIEHTEYKILLTLISVAVGVLLLIDSGSLLFVRVMFSVGVASFAFYKARKTLNLYRLIPLIVAMHAPLLVVIDHKATYFLSLLLSLVAFYLLGRFLERYYKSANMGALHSLVTAAPRFAFFLRLNLLNIALFPPFPVAVVSLISLLVVKVDFWALLGFFVTFSMMMLLAMRINAKTLYGKQNDAIDYHDLEDVEMRIQLILFVMLLLFSLFAFMEVV